MKALNRKITCSGGNSCCGGFFTIHWHLQLELTRGSFSITLSSSYSDDSTSTINGRSFIHKFALCEPATAEQWPLIPRLTLGWQHAHSKTHVHEHRHIKYPCFPFSLQGDLEAANRGHAQAKLLIFEAVFFEGRRNTELLINCTLNLNIVSPGKVK